VSAHGEPELQKEKIITKAICKILEGFHFEELEDVIEVMAAKQVDQEKGSGHVEEVKLWNNDFTDLLQEKINTGESGEQAGDQDS
jgi:hypothetical protein